MHLSTTDTLRDCYTVLSPDAGKIKHYEMPNLHGVLVRSLDVTKEYARGGGSILPEHILEGTYRKLLALEEEIERAGQ